MSKLEFYIEDDPKYIVSVDDGAVPRENEYVNIRKVTYQVKHVTWAVDHADNRANSPKLRANIVLKKEI